MRLERVVALRFLLFCLVLDNQKLNFQGLNLCTVTCILMKDSDPITISKGVLAVQKAGWRSVLVFGLFAL